MADVSKRLVGPAFLTTAATTVYTATGVIAQAVNIHVNNETGTDQTFGLSIGADGAGKRFLGPAQPVLANDGFDWTGLLVLAATEILQAFASANNALTLTISGVET